MNTPDPTNSDSLEITSRLGGIRLVTAMDSFSGYRREEALEITLNDSTLEKLSDRNYRQGIYNQILQRAAEINKCEVYQLPKLVRERLSIFDEDVIEHELSHYYALPEKVRSEVRLYLYFIGTIKPALTEVEKRAVLMNEDDSKLQDFMILSEVAGQIDFNIGKLSHEEVIRAVLAPTTPSMSDISVAKRSLNELRKINPELARRIESEFSWKLLTFDIHDAL